MNEAYGIAYHSYKNKHRQVEETISLYAHFAFVPFDALKQRKHKCTDVLAELVEDLPRYEVNAVLKKYQVKKI